jgi:hypothetical protein
VARENRNIALSIDGVLVDIFYHDDESFINEYAYRKYVLTISSFILSGALLQKDFFVTMRVQFKSHFDEATRVLRKLKIEKIFKN